MNQLEFGLRLSYSQGIDAPVIAVRIWRGRFYRDTYALLDTGAEFTIIDSELAEPLGLNLEDGPTENVYGVTGGLVSVPVRVVAVQVLAPSLTRPVVCRAGFLTNLRERIHSNILGRRDFFHAVHFALVHSERTVYLGQ